jgi:hypothetical protein
MKRTKADWHDAIQVPEGLGPVHLNFVRNILPKLVPFARNFLSYKEPFSR